MNPATLALIVQGLQAAIAAAPTVENVVTNAKNFVTSLFSAGAISVAQQNAVQSYINTVATAFANGQTPPEFTVQPDPAN